MTELLDPASSRTAPVDPVTGRRAVLGRRARAVDEPEPPADEPLPDWLLSFQPVDLAPIIAGTSQPPVPTMFERQGDGVRSFLIYPGTLNGLHGESGIGKSWCAIHLMAERMQLGENVMLIDLEDTGATIVNRLRLLGVPDDVIGEQLDYLQPDAPFGLTAVDMLCDRISERDTTLVVVDSLGEAFGLDGVNEDRDNEVGGFIHHVLRPMSRAGVGPAVVVIDHVPKAGGRHLQPSGSKRKRASFGGASYLVEAVTPFVKGRDGRLRLTCAKDRHGNYGMGEHVAWLDMTYLADRSLTLELIAAPPEHLAATDNLDELIGRRIRKVLAAEGAPRSKSALLAALRKSGLKASHATLRGTIDLMIERGELNSDPGPRNALMISLPPDAEPPE